jgi:hypothetical protein
MRQPIRDYLPMVAGVMLLFLLIGAMPVVAQETAGSVQGTVTDPSGAIIPNVQIEISSPNLARPLTATTDAAGTYRFPNLPVGTYSLTATATGFSTLKKTDVNVVLGRIAAVDFSMQVGSVSESVTVVADAAMVDTTSTASAINVDKSFFDQMPKGRGFYDLIQVAPGARNESKSGGYQIDGASGSENTYFIDGMEITNVQTGVLSSQNRIPVEVVQQVQVKNGVMDAQYGGAMGGVVNAVIRTGTNSFHGQAGFYFDNDSMSARPRPTLQMDPTDATRTKSRYFQNTMDDYSTWNPVFSLGGPIMKDKLFFFTGFMPTQTVTNRTVTFLSNNQTSTFEQKTRQHYVVNKLDYAPFSKIRTSMSWIWNPSYQQGALPARDGTDSPARNWAGLGNYRAGNILSGTIDYIATNKLLFSFRGGYNYSNFTDGYAQSTNTFIYSTANTMFTLPSSVQKVTSTGWVQQGTAFTKYDIYDRINLSADGSYLLTAKGQHNLKFGWMINKLSNSVNTLSYPNGYYRFYWDQSYACVTSQCSGRQRGTYGYYRWYTYGTLGDASSDNQGFYVQDSWTVNKRLTLNLGMRLEREFLPSFSKQGIEAAPPIEFGWGSKISPRLGAAWDPRGDGKMKIYGSYGEFYDVMKYEMPRGSFGGDIYLTYYYALDDPTVFETLKTYGYPADPMKLPGRFFEGVNWRIPSNDPNDSTVDPDLKPMKQRMTDLGFDYSINPSLVASVRYTNRRLIRTIEDVGTLTPAGEVYYIANPGFGLVADPKTWDAGYPTTPKAKRNYDAIELRLDQRFTRNFQYAASYTWAKQTGNYSGLASSDENGRTSPNVNRYFDLPWLGYDEKGKFAEGRLATDRPSTFKFFGAYTLNSKLGGTTFSPYIAWYSGSPLTTQINAISSVPVYPYGRGNLDRTPTFFRTDFNVMQEFKPFTNHEEMKLRVELTIFNLFNSSTVTNKDEYLGHPDDGQLQFANDTDIFKGFNTQALMTAQKIRVSPTYNLANGFMGPRSLRLQIAFMF